MADKYGRVWIEQPPLITDGIICWSRCQRFDGYMEEVLGWNIDGVPYDLPAATSLIQKQCCRQPDASILLSPISNASTDRSINNGRPRMQFVVADNLHYQVFPGADSHLLPPWSCTSTVSICWLAPRSCAAVVSCLRPTIEHIIAYTYTLEYGIVTILYYFIAHCY